MDIDGVEVSDLPKDVRAVHALVIVECVDLETGVHSLHARYDKDLMLWNAKGIVESISASLTDQWRATTEFGPTKDDDDT